VKALVLITVFVSFLTGAVFAQNIMPYEQVDGLKSLGSCPGTVIWENSAPTGWFSPMGVNELWLDWGALIDQGNGMPDEVIDGFGFSYATDATVGGIDWNIFFYDSYTGWGDDSLIQEAGFAFTDLPDATNLPPGNWGWMLWVDLRGIGYEFLMGYEVGIGHSLQTPGVKCGPRIGKPPYVGGNDPTGTKDGFDVIDNTGGYVGTYWFGGYPAYPYGSFCAQMMGASDPSTGCTYAGIVLQGNNTGLYCVGNWAPGGYNNFLLRMNEMTPTAGVIAHFLRQQTWHSSFKKTSVPRLTGCYKFIFAFSYTGDYQIFRFNCGPGAVAARWYIQGVISDWMNTPPGSPVPLDLSMDYVVTP